MYVYAPPDITQPNITTIWWSEDLLNFSLAQQFSPSSRNLLDGFYWETLSTKYRIYSKTTRTRI